MLIRNQGRTISDLPDSRTIPLLTFFSLLKLLEKRYRGQKANKMTNLENFIKGRYIM